MAHHEWYLDVFSEELAHAVAMEEVEQHLECRVIQSTLQRRHKISRDINSHVTDAVRNETDHVIAGSSATAKR